MLDEAAVEVNGVVDDFAEFGATFGDDFESDEIEVEFEDVADADDVVGSNEFVARVDNEANGGVLTHAGGGQDITILATNKRPIDAIGNDFEVVGINNRGDEAGDATAEMEAENWKVGEASAAG